MKVALLLYGQPRFVNRVDVFKSHIQDILSKYDVDTYCQLWYSSSFQYEDISTWAKNHGAVAACDAIPYDAPSYIMDAYNPMRMSIDKPVFEDPSESVTQYLKRRFGDNRYYSEGNMRNIISVGYALDRVCNLVYDRDNYDFYVLARYDAILENFPRLEMLNRNKFYVPMHGDFNDLIQIFGPSYLNTYEDMAYNVKNNLSWHQEVTLPIPELYKQMSYMRFHTAQRIEKINMYANVIRS